MGRYVLTPKILELLENQEAGKDNEIQLTDAIQRLNEIESVYCYDFEGKRYDVGEIKGYLKTTIELSLEREDIQKDLLPFLKEIVDREYVN